MAHSEASWCHLILTKRRIRAFPLSGVAHDCDVGTDGSGKPPPRLKKSRIGSLQELEPRRVLRKGPCTVGRLLTGLPPTVPASASGNWHRRCRRRTGVGFGIFRPSEISACFAVAAPVVRFRNINVSPSTMGCAARCLLDYSRKLHRMSRGLDVVAASSPTLITQKSGFPGRNISKKACCHLEMRTKRL